MFSLLGKTPSLLASRLRSSHPNFRQTNHHMATSTRGPVLGEPAGVETPLPEGLEFLDRTSLLCTVVLTWAATDLWLTKYGKVRLADSEIKAKMEEEREDVDRQIKMLRRIEEDQDRELKQICVKIEELDPIVFGSGSSDGSCGMTP